MNGRVYLELVVRGFEVCIRSIKEIFQRAVETGSVLSLQPLCMLHISKMGRKKKNNDFLSALLFKSTSDSFPAKKYIHKFARSRVFS